MSGYLRAHICYIYRPHLYPIFYFGQTFEVNRMFAIKFITFQVNKKIILTNYFRKSLCTCVLHKCRKTLLKVFLCNNPWSVFFDIKNFFSQELHFSFLYFVIRKVCRSEYNVRYRISSCLFNEIYDISFIILPFTFFGTLQPRVDKLTWELDLFTIVFMIDCAIATYTNDWDDRNIFCLNVLIIWKVFWISRMYLKTILYLEEVFFSQKQGGVEKQTIIWL